MGVYLAGASWFDVRSQRIPNWWSFLGILWGGLLRLVFSGEPVEVVWYFARVLVVIAFFFPLFIVRVLGAGDVKVMALLVGYLGLSSGIRVIGLGFLVGAVWGLGKMVWQRSLHRRWIILSAYIRRLILTREVVPYYQAQRDRSEGVLPFAVCLLLGFLGSYAL